MQFGIKSALCCSENLLEIVLENLVLSLSQSSGAQYLFNSISDELESSFSELRQELYTAPVSYGQNKLFNKQPQNWLCVPWNNYFVPSSAKVNEVVLLMWAELG